MTTATRQVIGETYSQRKERKMIQDAIEMMSSSVMLGVLAVLVYWYLIALA